MTAPPKASASSSASADLPLAVGPAMTRTDAASGCAGSLVVRAWSGVGRLLMAMVLTLIAGARGRSSLPSLARAIAATLGIGSEPNWLAPGEACDFALDATSAGRAEMTARTLIKSAPIDVLVQPVVGR